VPTAFRVLIVEDHELFRRGLVDLLTTEGFEVVATTAAAADAVALAQELRPDVVLMDTDPGDESSIDATRAIAALDGSIRVVALTAANSRRDVLGMVRAGADGYLTKDQSPEGLARALRGLDRGEAPIPRMLAAYLVDEVRRADRRRELAAMVPDREHLTPRQLEILNLLAEGSTTSSIASELFLSVETVRWHVKAILRKLGVKTRAEAVACLQELRAS
jgi:two-component system nitrate/nitrite response regulator NarL